jgi:hypothetical protein
VEEHLEAGSGADGPSGSSSAEPTLPDLAGDYGHGPGRPRDECGMTPPSLMAGNGLR